MSVLFYLEILWFAHLLECANADLQSLFLIWSMPCQLLHIK